MLSKTYSRGALVAGLVALGWWTLSNRQPGRWRWLSTRLVIVIACVIFTGFVSRVTPAFVATDRSVSNRWELWHEAIRMIEAAPFHGWGSGESGRAFMNWFQPLDRMEGYATMVNSFLQVGVEQGLLVLFLALGIFGWLLVASWQLAHAAWSGRRSSICAGGACLVAWLSANIFSTLWIVTGLWIVPICSMVFIGSAAVTHDFVKSARSLVTCMLVALVAATGFGLVGQTTGPTIQPSGRNGNVAIIRPEGTAFNRTDGAWHIWTDKAVLGDQPGKEIRRWLNQPGAPAHSVIHPLVCSRSSTVNSGQGAVMLFGQQAGRLGHDIPWPADRVTIVHPYGRTPAVAPAFSTIKPSRITVILPSLDQTGDQEAWRTWAKLQHAIVQVSPGVGLDIRPVWPDVANTAMRHP